MVGPKLNSWHYRLRYPKVLWKEISVAVWNHLSGRAQKRTMRVNDSQLKNDVNTINGPLGPKLVRGFSRTSPSMRYLDIVSHRIDKPDRPSTRIQKLKTLSSPILIYLSTTTGAMRDGPRIQD